MPIAEASPLPLNFFPAPEATMLVRNKHQHDQDSALCMPGMPAPPADKAMDLPSVPLTGHRNTPKGKNHRLMDERQAVVRVAWRPPRTGPVEPDPSPFRKGIGLVGRPDTLPLLTRGVTQYALVRWGDT